MTGSEIEPNKFEGWAIVELMGHQQEVGYVKTEVYGTTVLFRVDVPELPEKEYALPYARQVGDRWLEKGSKVKRSHVAARSRLVSAGAIYAINPCTEKVAHEFLEQQRRVDLAVAGVLSQPDGPMLAGLPAVNLRPIEQLTDEDRAFFIGDEADDSEV